MSYTVEIDERACAAHGECTEIAPEVFALGDVAEVVGQGPDDVLLEAAQACPAMAIRLLEAGGRQVYP
jgi:ferredoxin